MKPDYDIDKAVYVYTFHGLALAHNVATLLLFCAFIIADNPRPPKLTSLTSLTR